MLVTLVVLTVAAAQLGAAVVARHRAQAAADLAALAAATRVPAGAAAACEESAAVAHRLGASGHECALDGLDVVVTVEVTPALLAWPGGPARAAARAGPAT